jgi:hypothetical protein
MFAREGASLLAPRLCFGNCVMPKVSNVRPFSRVIERRLQDCQPRVGATMLLNAVISYLTSHRNRFNVANASSAIF